MNIFQSIGIHAENKYNSDFLTGTDRRSDRFQLRQNFDMSQLEGGGQKHQENQSVCPPHHDTLPSHHKLPLSSLSISLTEYRSPDLGQAEGDSKSMWKPERKVYIGLRSVDMVVGRRSDRTDGVSRNEVQVLFTGRWREEFCWLFV